MCWAVVLKHVSAVFYQSCTVQQFIVLFYFIYCTTVTVGPAYWALVPHDQPLHLDQTVQEVQQGQGVHALQLGHWVPAFRAHPEYNKDRSIQCKHVA